MLKCPLCEKACHDLFVLDSADNVQRCLRCCIVEVTNPTTLPVDPEVATNA